MMESKNLCNVCKIRAYIICEVCQSFNKIFYFCSKLHLTMHLRKAHSSNVNQTLSNKSFKNDDGHENSNKKQVNENHQQINLRALFESLQKSKLEIEKFMENKQFTESIQLIKKSLNISINFYQQDDYFILELHYKLAECYSSIHNLEESINSLQEIISLSQNARGALNVENLRYKTFMFICGLSLNIGDHKKSLQYLGICEKEILEFFSEPEVNIKLSSIYLNYGIVYINLNNYNLSVKYLKKGLSQTEGMLGNDVVDKINSDFYENLGIINENNLKFQEALEYFKKSLKIKFRLLGDKDDEVLDLQYKIGNIYLLTKQPKDSEQVLSSLTEVIMNEKIRKSNIENYYRYGCYFYTYGISLMKNNKANLAKNVFKKVKKMWEEILPLDDPGLISINNLSQLCEEKIKNNI